MRNWHRAITFWSVALPPQHNGAGDILERAEQSVLLCPKKNIKKSLYFY